MSGATFPRSIEAEQSVIGALLIDAQAIDRIGSLEPRHFFDDRNRRIFAAVAALAAAGTAFDGVSVFEYLGGAQGDDDGLMAYLTALEQSVYTTAHAGQHADIVREKAAHRALLETADEALAIARDGDDAVAQKVDRIVTAFGQIQREQVRKMPRAVADIAIQRTAYYEDLEQGRVVAGWPTGIPTLDAMLNGGLREGGLYVLAARPSVGKSSFSQSIGIRMAQQGLPTLFLSQEMAESEVADRAVANVGRITYASLLSGRMSHDDWTRATEAMEELRTSPFYVDDQGSLTLLDIRAKARSVKGLKVLIVDYLQLCASTRKDGNRNAEIEEISRGLKSLAKEMGVAVIALSQLNRQVEQRASKRPSLSDLRDSGAIEQDADVVLFLWPFSDLGDNGRVIGCGIDKNRQGRIGQFPLHFFGATQQWGESNVDMSKPQHEPRGRGGRGDL